jgi:uncharacterized membrane protein
VDLYVIVLRIVHILAGVFWVGSAAFFFFFVEPTAKRLGPQAGPVMQELMVRRKVPIFITASSGLTVLAGVLLYWRSSGGLDVDWITSAPGLAFTVGGLAAIGAFAMGLAVIKPAVDRMGALGAEIAASGGPPSPQQGAQLLALETRLRNVGRIDIVLLTLAVLTMATARYL